MTVLFRHLIAVVGIVWMSMAIFAADPNDPNIIASAADWQSLMNTPSGWNKSYILTADIDLTGITASPVGTYETPFTGVMNGNGHVISHLSMIAPQSNYVGLFGMIRGGQVYKLGLRAVSISGKNYIGGIVGYNLGGKMDSCFVTGLVTGQSFVGGLAGYSIKEN